jgi:uncharacterized protein YjiS (DUF1127 family)
MNWALKHWKHKLSDKELMDLGILRFNIETVVRQITIEDM